jgi:tRNA modification GTPase
MSARSRSQRKPTRSAAGTRGDTIVAIATAGGRSALAVVRISGGDALAIAGRVLTPRYGLRLAHRTAVRCDIHEPDDPRTPIDDGVATLYDGTQSFTGEPTVEISTHGGLVVPTAVLAALIRAGARAAAPGEFSERAVLNGKLDLVRAEAIADLIDARSRSAHRTALHQLSGALSARLGALREGILALEALLAYDIDFPEEDSGAVPRDRITAAAHEIIAQLDILLATVPAAILGRDGATVVLAGAPNAGKSSLLNALVGESRVLVSDTPGTTRDAVEVVLDADPWPLRLVDTAGLRETDDATERLGIEFSARYLAKAHVVIACAEHTAAVDDTVAAIRALTDAPVVVALTKRDLVSESYEIGRAAGAVVPVSAQTGAGLAPLLAAVLDATRRSVAEPDADTPVISRARHRTALETARAELAAFADAWTADALPAPVAAVHVQAAAGALDSLIGVIDVDEVFGRVFATFCVGK